MGRAETGKSLRIKVLAGTDLNPRPPLDLVGTNRPITQGMKAGDREPEALVPPDDFD
jgi:hypothetical protein